MESSDSIFLKPAGIALLANENALDDLTLFLETLLLWTPIDPPPLYVYCTQRVEDWFLPWKAKYPNQIHLKVALEQYRSYSRKQMELLQSQKGLSNLFHDFTQEKCDLVEWALESLPETERERGILFCDADILWLGPVPKIPNGKQLALSPHMIRNHDEALYGKYNAGFLWTNSQQMPSIWREACKHSRFFEQAALEEVNAKLDGDSVYEFGPEINYGWWRLYQSSLPFLEQTKKWSIFRTNLGDSAGLFVEGKQVSCIHTHWKTTDFTTQSFNTFISEKLKLLVGQPKIKKLLKLLSIRY